MICARINDELIPLKGYTNYHIIHAQDGFDTLCFSISMNSEQYALLKEEVEIQTDANEWVIKKINDERIVCEMNLDFLKASFFREYNSGSVLLAVLLAEIFDGWTILNAGVSTILRTISAENVTYYEIVPKMETTYNVRFLINAKTKTLTVVDPSGAIPQGEYITDELNLTSLSYHGATSEIITRLYAYGKDGLTVEDAIVDGARYGVEYIDNNEYMSKIVCGYWEDERFTDATSLYNAAKARLAQLAIPEQSYECSVVDLAKLDSTYSFLDFALHKKLTLIDTRRNLRVVHTIVEYDEYPDEPTRNVVTLASTPQTVTSYVKGNIGGVVDMLNNSNVYETETRQILKELTETVTSLQSTISDNAGNITIINQSISEISSAVSSLNSSVSTLQSDSEYRWDFVQRMIQDADGNTISISEYIRFKEGSICLGSSRSPIKIRIENNDNYKRVIFFSGDDFDDEDITIFSSFDASELYDQFVRALASIYVGYHDQPAFKIDNTNGVFAIRRV